MSATLTSVYRGNQRAGIADDQQWSSAKSGENFLYPFGKVIVVVDKPGIGQPLGLSLNQFGHEGRNRRSATLRLIVEAFCNCWWK